MTKQERYAKVQMALDLLCEVEKDLDTQIEKRPASYSGKMCDQSNEVGLAIERLLDSGMCKEKK